MTVVSTSPLDEVADVPVKPSRRWRLKGVPWIPLVILTLVIIAAIGGEWIAPHDPGALNLGLAFRPPFWQAGGSFEYLLGTDNLAKAASVTGVERFVLVSTDKAADPTSVLGATKRLAECVVSQYSGGATRFASVRFGNVLGSRGSFLDTLRHQVCRGMPVTVTHPDVDRYFMSVSEAVGLVIEASVMAQRGETYVLDMGEPIRIVDLVHRYAAAIGVAQPTIEFVGLRDGEKLSESLFAGDETRRPTVHQRIWQTEQTVPGVGFVRDLHRLYALAADCDDDSVFELLDKLTMRLAIAA